MCLMKVFLISLLIFIPSEGIALKSACCCDELSHDFIPEVMANEALLMIEEDSSTAHPLRTAEWRMSESNLFHFKRKQYNVTFHINGTLVCDEGEKGSWWFDVGGLHWEIERDDTILHHKAELHWNIFGKQPRMFRGIVTRDRRSDSFLPKWLFRPVIGTFTGLGIGEDTSDTSYQHRTQGTDGRTRETSVARDTRYDRH